eukprot:6181264-Amphidinium_carterae.1
MFGGLPGKSAQQLLARILLLAEQGGESGAEGTEGLRASRGVQRARSSLFVAQLDVEKYFNGIDTPGLKGAFDALGLGAFGELLATHCCHYTIHNKFWGSHTGTAYHLVRGAPQGDPWSMWLSLVHVLLLVRAAQHKVKGRWECFAFIDDLTITASSKEAMLAVVSCIADQLSKFGLVLNWSKSSWTSNGGSEGCADERNIGRSQREFEPACDASDPGCSGAGKEREQESQCVEEACQQPPLPYVKQSVLLGADLCCLETLPEMSSKREGRIQESKARLLRARHLPCHERRRAMIIATTALSPMGWIPIGPRPTTKELRVLRHAILKSIFGHATHYRESAYE